jgi:hypothetical protein
MLFRQAGISAAFFNDPTYLANGRRPQLPPVVV